MYGGGGVENFNGTPTPTLTLTNCTVSGDSTSAVVVDLSNNDGIVVLTNAIVAGNSGGDTSGSYLGRNNLIGVDPLLASLGNCGGPTPTFALLPGSLAIGKDIRADYPGTSAPITTDQRSFRFDSTASDISGSQTNPRAVNTTVDGTGSSFGSLRLRQAAINLANVLGGTQVITFDPTVFATPRTIILDRTQLELEAQRIGRLRARAQTC